MSLSELERQIIDKPRVDDGSTSFAETHLGEFECEQRRERKAATKKAQQQPKKERVTTQVSKRGETFMFCELDYNQEQELSILITKMASVTHKTEAHQLSYARDHANVMQEQESFFFFLNSRRNRTHLSRFNLLCSPSRTSAVQLLFKGF